MAKTTTRAAKTTTAAADVVMLDTTAQGAQQAADEALQTRIAATIVDAFKAHQACQQAKKTAAEQNRAIYVALRKLHTAADLTIEQGAAALDAAIVGLAEVRAGEVKRQVIPFAQSLRTAYAGLLINPMMGEADGQLIYSWILRGGMLRSGAVESLTKKADKMGIDLTTFARA